MSPFRNWTQVLENAPDKSQKIVDLGCGNGHLLLELVRIPPHQGSQKPPFTRQHFPTNQSSLGYTSLTGIDYSHPAITLATKIADEQSRQITYQQHDLLAPSSPIGPFDLALDKGTFDAISLAEKEDDGKAHPADGYAKAVSELLKEGGILLITSCNWVEAELVGRFEECEFGPAGGLCAFVEGRASRRRLQKLIIGLFCPFSATTDFTVHSRVKYPTFTFGGVSGQKITTVAFEKK